MNIINACYNLTAWFHLHKKQKQKNVSFFFFLLCPLVPARCSGIILVHFLIKQWYLMGKNAIEYTAYRYDWDSSVSKRSRADLQYNHMTVKVIWLFKKITVLYEIIIK